jgi:hypothetical protein
MTELTTTPSPSIPLAPMPVVEATAASQALCRRREIRNSAKAGACAL